MLSAISITPHVQHELVTAQRHWGSKVKIFLINTLGSWREKILTAAAVYEMVQAIFLVLGGYFLAAVISAAMSALFVKTIKDLREFANLDKATSLIKEEGYKYGLLNLQHKKNNADFRRHIEELKQENIQYGQHNLKHEALNIQHEGNNRVHTANNETHGLNNAVHGVNNTIQQFNNDAHQANNADQQANNAEQQANNVYYEELNLRNMILVEEFRDLLNRGHRNQEEFSRLAYESYERYKGSVQEICQQMMEQADERSAKEVQRANEAYKRMVEHFKGVTLDLIESAGDRIKREQEELDQDRAHFRKERQEFEEEKRQQKLILEEQRKGLDELRDKYQKELIEANQRNIERFAGNNTTLEDVVSRLAKMETRMDNRIDELGKVASTFRANRHLNLNRGNFQPQKHPLEVN